MNFETHKQAVVFAKIETVVTHRKHIAIKTFYYKDLTKRICWTVILQGA